MRKNRNYLWMNVEEFRNRISLSGKWKDIVSV